MDRWTNELNAKIIATNKANAYANELYEKLVTVFKPLVGQQIMKKDGTLLAKYEKLLPTFVNTGPISVYRSSSHYSLSWTVKTCVVTDGIGVYAEATVYVGDLSEGSVLTSICKPNNYRSDYTLAEVEKNRKAAREAKEVYNNAKSACFPFGE